MAEEAGLDPAIADAIAAGEVPTLGDDARAVYDFVTSLLATGQVTDDQFAAVVARWGATGAADLIGVTGYYTLVSFVLNVDRYPVPGDPPLL
jgi:4-carboxymuconolactone decarboxylase